MSEIRDDISCYLKGHTSVRSFSLPLAEEESLEMYFELTMCLVTEHSGIPRCNIKEV